MNILHIINGWPAGGIAEQTYLICKHVPGNHFTIGYCHFDGYFVKKFEEIGVPCIKSDPEYLNLLKVILDNDIDIVHKQTGGGDYPGYANWIHSYNCKFVETLHCPRASAIPVSLLDAITYTTQYTEQKNTLEHKKIMKSIQYALDIKEPFREKANTFYNSTIPFIPETAFVGRLGRIVPDKRPDVIIELAKKSWKKYGNKIKFCIAGMIPDDYPLHIEYGKKFLEEVEKLPNVLYEGFVDDKYEFWKNLDICINPVWETSFDIVFLEAMAFGIPILTWDNSAAKYVVKEAGIVTEENIDDLFLGLERLFEHGKMRVELGNNGIEYIKTIYSLDRFVEDWTKLYEDIIAK